MLGLAQYLACHRITLNTLRGYVRPLQPGECLLLVGSVAEGLANPESDLDLLLIADFAGGAPDRSGDVLRVMPEGFDLNIEVVSQARAAAVCRFFRDCLDEAGRRVGAGAPRALTFVGADELRLLHRLRTGIPLMTPTDTLDELRERHALHALADFCVLQHLACHLRLLADARQTARDPADAHTALLMCQLAAQHLVAALLASAGETNPNPKWLLRMLRDHAGTLRPFAPAALGRLVLAGADAVAVDCVAELLALSETTLARLAADARNAGSPTAAAIADLAPRRCAAEPVECEA